MTANFRIALVQMSCSADPDANLDKAAERVRDAARAGANVVCLPELFRAQYFCQREDHSLFDLAESIPGPSTEKLSRIAREEKVAVIASLFERRAAGQIGDVFWLSAWQLPIQKLKGRKRIGWVWRCR